MFRPFLFFASLVSLLWTSPAVQSKERRTDATRTPRTMHGRTKARETKEFLGTFWGLTSGVPVSGSASSVLSGPLLFKFRIRWPHRKVLPCCPAFLRVFVTSCEKGSAPSGLFAVFHPCFPKALPWADEFQPFGLNGHSRPSYEPGSRFNFHVSRASTFHFPHRLRSPYA
jgi:hypothetical protein